MIMIQRTCRVGPECPKGKSDQRGETINRLGGSQRLDAGEEMAPQRVGQPPLGAGDEMAPEREIRRWTGSEAVNGGLKTTEHDFTTSSRHHDVNKFTTTATDDVNENNIKDASTLSTSNITDENRKKNNADVTCMTSRDVMRSWLLYGVDNVLCALLVGPLTVFCWRGLWNYLNLHLYPSQRALSGALCMAVGNIGLLILVLTQSLLKAGLHADNRVHWWLGYHLFTCVCFFLNVCHWRGLWTLLDVYMGMDFNSAWINIAIGQGCLMLLRCTKTAQAPPMSVAVDIDPEFFTYSTRFRTKAGLTESHLLDVGLTVVIIHQLVVFYWRGVWVCMETLIFPDNLAWSGAITLVIGYVLFLTMAILQPPLNALYRSRFVSVSRPVLRWLLELVTFTFSNVVNVAVWRGVWVLCDCYILSDTPDVSNGITLAIGWVGLMLMGCGNSLTVRGCEVDGNARDEDGCKCPTRYLRFILDQRRNERVDCKSGRSDKDVMVDMPQGNVQGTGRVNHDNTRDEQNHNESVENDSARGAHFGENIITLCVTDPIGQVHSVDDVVGQNFKIITTPL